MRLNFSKRGISTSFGPRGLHYTVGHGRRRTTVGLPGTGLSYTTTSSAHPRPQRAATPRARSPRAPAGAAPGVTAHAGPNGLAQLAAMTPPQKIAWGLLLTLLVITSPIGLWLLITGLWQLHVPEWRVRTYVRQAGLEPAHAADLLARAAAIDPNSPEVLAPLADLCSAQGDHQGALELHRRYAQQEPTDWEGRGHLALAELHGNHIDAAIAELVAIQQHAAAGGDAEASVAAHLAYAYLCKEDPQQALALCEGDAARASAGEPGGQQCLFYRAVCRYMLGRTSAAIGDLDRLYAINPAYEGLQATKDAMAAQSYELLLPDGSALVPVNPGVATRAVIKVSRSAPRSPHCRNCQAPLQAGAVECRYCHAQVGSAENYPPPPPAPPA